MSLSRLLILTILAMVAFAGNSVLCRLALKQTDIDPASFTTIRLLSGAITLALIVLIHVKPTSTKLQGDWWSATALVIYAAGFSYAYVLLSTGTGALLFDVLLV